MRCRASGARWTAIWSRWARPSWRYVGSNTFAASVAVCPLRPRRSASVCTPPSYACRHGGKVQSSWAQQSRNETSGMLPMRASPGPPSASMERGLSQVSTGRPLCLPSSRRGDASTLSERVGEPTRQITRRGRCKRKTEHALRGGLLCPTLWVLFLIEHHRLCRGARKVK